MSLRKYYLMVDLIIDEKPVTVNLAKFDLMSLEKYTSFCNGPEELLFYMPKDDYFSAKNFISSHIKKPISIDNDPFSIRTSKSNKAKKIKIIYKKDLDILLAGKRALLSKITRNYKLTIDDCVNGDFTKEEEQTLIYMFNKFAGSKFNKAVSEVLEEKLNMDYTYDKRYLVPNNKKWMFIALSSDCALALIEDAFKDDRKRLELASFLKDKTGNLLPNISEFEINMLLDKLNDRVSIRKGSNFHIRNDINKNLYEFNSEITKLTKKQPSVSAITEEEIIDYNKQRQMNPKLEKIVELCEKIENLKFSLKNLTEEKTKLEELLEVGSFTESKASINKRLELKKENINELEKQMSQLEYEVYCLESDNAVYSDAGFIVEKGKEI